MNQQEFIKYLEAQVAEKKEIVKKAQDDITYNSATINTLNTAINILRAEYKARLVNKKEIKAVTKAVKKASDKTKAFLKEIPKAEGKVASKIPKA